MRWLSRKPVDGEKHLARRFLWLPLTISGETRWLEWAHIEYNYDGEYGAWYAVRWL